MRIRSIRPEFWSSEDIARLSWNERLIFIGLWSYVDDNGVGRDLERLIVADLFPLDEDLSEASLRVHGALKRLQAGGQITRYAVDGKRFLHITSWDKHQKINRPSDGRYPLPTCGNAETHGGLTEPSLSPHDTLSAGEGEKGRRGEGEKAASRRAPETPIPPDWRPTQAHQDYAHEHGLDLPAEVFKFRNHAIANDRRQRQWNATFSTWLAKAVEYAPRQSPRAHRTDLPEAWQ